MIDLCTKDGFLTKEDLVAAHKAGQTTFYCAYNKHIGYIYLPPDADWLDNSWSTIASYNSPAKVYGPCVIRVPGGPFGVNPNKNEWEYSDGLVVEAFLVCPDGQPDWRIFTNYWHALAYLERKLQAERRNGNSL